MGVSCVMALSKAIAFLKASVKVTEDRSALVARVRIISQKIPPYDLLVVVLGALPIRTSVSTYQKHVITGHIQHKLRKGHERQLHRTVAAGDELSRNTVD